MRRLVTKSRFESFTSEQAVKRGLAYLNHYLPDWRQYIDVEALYQDRRKNSVYAQLHDVLAQHNLLPVWQYEGEGDYKDADGHSYKSAYHWGVSHGFWAWASEPASYDSEMAFCWLAAARGERWDLTKIHDGDAESFIEAPTDTPRHNQHYHMAAETLSKGTLEYLIEQHATVTSVVGGFEVELPHGTIYRYDRWQNGHERYVWLMPDGTIIGHERGGLLFFFESPENRASSGQRGWQTWMDVFFPDYAK